LLALVIIWQGHRKSYKSIKIKGFGIKYWLKSLLSRNRTKVTWAHMGKYRMENNVGKENWFTPNFPPVELFCFELCSQEPEEIEGNWPGNWKGDRETGRQVGVALESITVQLIWQPIKSKSKLPTPNPPIHLATFPFSQKTRTTGENKMCENDEINERMQVKATGGELSPYYLRLYLKSHWNRPKAILCSEFPSSICKHY